MTFSTAVAQPGPSAEWSARKREIWDQLGTIFLHEGFRSLTVGDLADRLSCSRRTLYSLASSRDELVLGVVEQFFTTRSELAAAAAAPVSGVDAIVALLSNGLMSFEGRGVFFDDVVGRPATNRAFQAYRAASREALVRIVTDGVDAGELRVTDPALTADLLEAVSDRIADQRLRAERPLGRDAATAVLTAIVRGWLTAP